ncbi:hypothetical protein H5410_055979 [Solanum commersonii]|uniref:Uncharacterized protein n=1 Tax=Solanum commersonii TaxID=4109 RepID=A0A9J5WKC9_SOLCO|nr:hypothetical protein H5410_055979 [Solanum commersonii]
MWPADNSNEKGDVLSSSGGTKTSKSQMVVTSANKSTRRRRRVLMGSEANGKGELRLLTLSAFEGGAATRAEAADGVRFYRTYNGHHTLCQRPVYMAAC